MLNGANWYTDSTRYVFLAESLEIGADVIVKILAEAKQRRSVRERTTQHVSGFPHIRTATT